MRFLDLFSGIGGFRLGMEIAGHECVGFCEIDKFARASYKAIYDTHEEIEWHDIRQVTDDQFRQLRGRVDVICGGFPCQSFSVAGQRKGFLDGTRGTLFFELARAVKQIKPSLIFLENVTGLLSHEKGRTFRTILATIDELGYNAEWQVLNSKDFGVPQNRARVFIIGHLRIDRGNTSQFFPLRSSNFTHNPNIVKGLGNVNPSKRGINGQVYDADVLSPTLTTNKGEGTKIKVSIIQNSHGFNKGGEHYISPTLTSNAFEQNNFLKIYDTHNQNEVEEVGSLTANGHRGLTPAGTFVVSNSVFYRKLTPRECWRLQGFPDSAFDRAKEVNSNSQLYKQAGNSVTVNVIAEIAKRMEKIHD